MLIAIFTCGIGARFFSISTPIGQLSVFRIMLILSLICIIVDPVHARKMLIWFGETKKIIIMIAVWLAYAVITVLWSKDYSSWFQAIYFLIIFILCLVMMQNHINTSSDFIMCLKVFNMGALLQAVIGLIECLTGNYLFKIMNDRDYMYLVTTRHRVPLALCFSENEFATLMFFASACCLFFLLTERRVRKKGFYLICLLSYGVLIALTTSRAVLIGFILLLGVILLLYGHKGWGILAFGSIILLLLPPVQKVLKGLFTFDFVSGNNSESVRIALIKNGLSFVGDTYGFGIGAGQVQYWLEHKASYGINGIYDMHNWWIEILSEYGIAIFLLYILSYVYIFKTFFKYRKNQNKNVQIFSRIVCGFLCGFIIASLSTSSLFRNEAMWTFFALIISSLHFMNPNNYENKILC